jgi:hypothetical protein
MTKLFLFTAGIILTLVSCVEPYWPEMKSGSLKLLVVNALITDDPGIQYVKLSHPSSLDNQQFNPVNTAKVTLHDNKGNDIPFLFDLEGLYAPVDFAGIPGRSYKLIIELNDGTKYESDYQVLHSVRPFDSLYYSIEEKPTNNPEANLEGAQFKIDYKSRKDSDQYYLFQMVETYEYKPDLLLVYKDKGDGPEEVLPADRPPSRCWQTNKIKQFYQGKILATGNTQEQSLPLVFVPFNTKQFSVRYSLLINQVAVSEEVYNLYSEFYQQNSSGSLYATQPYSIKGNIHCVTNPSEQVLGSFVAGGIYQQRSFFNSPSEGHFTYDQCEAVTDPMALGKIMSIGGTYKSPLYFTEIEHQMGWGMPECFFCEMAGGTAIMPDFWIDQ